ncbi:MAG: (deoxy)nucleoside triphosphate pyrophosphohydrolase [Candidatus Paceibacterota bacterium]
MKPKWFHTSFFMIKVAAALIFDEYGNFLIAERADGSLAGKWEFPGGKIEEGETENEAVVREIMEELGVQVVTEKIVGVFSHAYPDREVELILIQCFLSEDQKIISDGSHSSHAWVALSDCEKYDFAPLDREIVEFLNQANTK